MLGIGFIDKFYRWVVDKPLQACALILIITTGFTYGLIQTKVDNSIEALFVETDPTVQAFREFTDVFGSSEIAALAFKDDTTIFKKANLEMLRKITDRISEEVPYIVDVISLTNAKRIRGEDGAIIVENLIEEIPDDGTVTMAALAESAINDKLFKKVLISSDGKTSSIVVKTEYIPGDDKYRAEITKKLRIIIDEETANSSIDFRMGGPPVFLTVFNEYIVQDLMSFGPVTALLLIFLLFVTFRHWNGMVVPMATVGIGLVWTIGFMTFMGKKINLSTTIVPPLVLVIGVANVVHFINIFNHEMSLGKEKKEAVYDALSHLGTPMFMASFSTAIGFLSLMVSDISVIRETGMIAAFGVMGTLIVSLVIPPAILLWAKPSEKLVEDYKSRLTSGPIGKTINVIHDLNENKPNTVITIGAAIALFFAAGIPRINVETNFVKYFKADSPIVQSQEFLSKNLSGVAPLEVFVDAGEGNTITDPQVLREMEAIQNVIDGEQLVDHTLSSVDFLKILRRAFYNGDPAYYSIPDDTDEIRQLYLVYELQGGGAGLEDFAASKYRYGRISSRLQDAGTNELAAVINNAQAEIDKSTSGASYRFADNTNMIVNIVDNLITSQAESLLLAFALIFFMMWWFLRAVKYGVIAMIPNAFPIVVVLGTMGYLGIDLNVSTVMVPAIALGLAVDDTIHLFSRFAEEFQRSNGDRIAAARATINTTGRACLFTSINLCAGFVTLGLSNFYPNIYFGLLSAVTVSAAVFSDLTITMALLRKWGPEATR